MSSSAFTPSTTTVTNNVPVNVPVVEASQLITATVTNGGTISGQRVNISRVGDKLFFEGSINFASAGPVAGFNLNMPTGLTIDTSKIDSGTGAYGNHIGTAGWWDNGVGSKQLMPWVVSSTRIAFAIHGASVNLQGSDLANSDSITFALFLPIAEWAGSGTTTLATRAVEEYAYNTDTTAANSTTQFGNGPDGVLFPNITAFGTNYSKRVRFQTPILPTDHVVVEWQRAGSGPWTNAAQRFTFLSQGSSSYGLQIVPVSSTDVDIQFRAQGGLATNGTYAGNGEAWSAYFAEGSKWRVRKVSSGAQVGYPVSARNIVGDTSGSVVPVGMLGERITWATAPVTQALTTTEADWTNAVINLTPGTWQIFANIQISYDCSAVAGAFGRSEFKVTDSSNNLIQNLNKQIATRGNANFVSSVLSASGTVTISSNTSYKIRVLRADLTGTNAGNVLNTSTAFSEFYAIRIA